MKRYLIVLAILVSPFSFTSIAYAREKISGPTNETQCHEAGGEWAGIGLLRECLTPETTKEKEEKERSSRADEKVKEATAKVQLEGVFIILAVLGGLVGFIAVAIVLVKNVKFIRRFI